MKDQKFYPGEPHNGTYYNYDLQVWVKGGVVMSCAHPSDQPSHENHSCTQHEYSGLDIEEAVAEHAAIAHLRDAGALASQPWR